MPAVVPGLAQSTGGTVWSTSKLVYAADQSTGCNQSKHSVQNALRLTHNFIQSDIGHVFAINNT